MTAADDLLAALHGDAEMWLLGHDVEVASTVSAPLLDRITELQADLTKALTAYRPPVPTFGLDPGVDYPVGVQPYLDTGQTLREVEPGKPVPDTDLVATGTGNIVIDKPNQHLELLHLPTGRIIARAPDWVVDRCRPEGDQSGSTVSRWLVDATHPAAVRGLLVDSTLRPAMPGPGFGGFNVPNGTVLRCDVSRVIDGFDLFPAVADLHVAGLYVHDLVLFSPDPHHDTDAQPVNAKGTRIGASHADGAQISSSGRGSRVLIAHSNIQGFLDPAVGEAARPKAYPNAAGGYNPWHALRDGMIPANAALMVAPSTGPVSGVTLIGNLLDGGSVSVNIGSKAGIAPVDSCIVALNRLGRRQTYPNAPIRWPAAATNSLCAGNVHADDGTPITPTVY